MKKLLVIGLLLAGASLCAVPDCQMKLKATSRLNDPAATEQRLVTIPAIATNWGYYDNRVPQCVAWELSYDSEGFSNIGISLRSALSFYNSSTQLFSNGTFVAFAGTITTGTNPMTDLSSGYLTALGYYPYIRVQVLNSSITDNPVGTGSINIVLNGWKSPNMFSKLRLKKEVTK